MVDDPYAETAMYMRGFQVSKMLSVAAELLIADRLRDRPRPVAEIAAESGAHPEMLLRLCKALASFGIFAVDQENNLLQTPRSACLRTDATPTLHYAALFWGMPSTWSSWGNLGETVRTGRPAFEATYGMPNFEYLKTNPQEGSIFDDFMRHSPDDRHAAVAATYDFSGAQVVVDVGGGNGGLLKAILDVHVGVRGILFDQSGVVAGAARILNQHAGRCEIVGGNFFADALPAGDIHIMSQILHDWSDERCLEILVNCRRAMTTDGRLLIIERVLDDSPLANLPMNYLSDMQMMVLFPGAKERTLAEFSELFRRAGFMPPDLIATRSVFSILETRPSE